MTLALYGKTRRRQGSLILLGVFAVLMALLTGVSVFRSEDASAASSGVLVAPTAHESDGCDSSSGGNAYGAGFVTCDDNESVTYKTFNYAVPPGATITGIKVELVHSTLNNGSLPGGDGVYVAVHNGTSFSADRLLETDDEGTPPSDTDDSGGSGDLWSLSWSVAGANAIKVRVKAEAIGYGSQKAYFDDVKVAIYYTTPPTATPTPVPPTATPAPADADGDGVSNASDQCPFTASGATTYYGSGCSVDQYIGMLHAGTANTISGNFCAQGDFNFVIDMSGSIGEQDGFPSNLPAMKTGITGFVNAYNAPAPGTGDGRYSGTKFNDSSASGITGGFVSDSTFNTAVNALSGPSGLTPTGAGITSAVGNNGGDRAGAPNMMFVVTDGSPNVPPGSPLTNPMTWVTAANAAIDAADSARASYLVRAIYVSTAGDPGDTNLPFNATDDAKWAKAVMDRIDGSASGYLGADFSTLATDLLNASGCNPSIVKSDGTVDAGAGTISWTITVTNLYGTPKTFTVADSDSTAKLTASTCTNSPATGSSAPWSCTVPANGGTATLTVTTDLPANFDTCKGGEVTNTATLYDGTNKLGEDSGSWSHAGGVNCPPEEIDLHLTVCKIIDPASSDTNESFTISVDGTPNTYPVNGAGPDNNYCRHFTYTVPANAPTKTVNISETPPSGWEQPKYTEQSGAGAPTSPANLPVPAGTNVVLGEGTCQATAAPQLAYESLQQNTVAAPDCTVTIYNKKATRELRVCKHVESDSYSGGSFTIQVEGQSNFVTDPIAAGGDDCATYDVTPGVELTLTESGFPAGWIGASGYPLVGAANIAAVNSNTINVTVGDSTCGGDSSQTSGTADCTVTFYNKSVQPTREIEITKHFVNLDGDYQPTSVDYPTFTFDPVPAGFDFATDCSASGTNPVTWTCQVPYDWNGTITENPATGWEQVTCDEQTYLQQVAELVKSLVQFATVDGPRSYWAFCNQPVGEVQVIKYENVPPGTTQTWNFTGTLPSTPFNLSTSGTPALTDSDMTIITKVPAGTYSVAETEGRRECQPGDSSTDWETRAIVQVGGTAPDASDLNSASVVSNGAVNATVEPGKTTYVVFGNIGCGSILSSQQLVVTKYNDPAGNFTGNTGLAGWTMTITGTAGAATGFVASQPTNASGSAVFPGIPDGTYQVCETAQANWAVIGSKYNATTQAGVCRTGVVVGLEQTIYVDFYNQPRVNIQVIKQLQFNGINVAGPNWEFTVEGCDIVPVSQTTDGTGVTTFSNLPPAVGCTYVVTETLQAGFTAVTPSQNANPTAPGQTVVLTFVNIPNTDETPTPTPTPSETPTTTTTPTTTPPTTTTTSTQPPLIETKTPEPKTPEPTETSLTAGEKTPGPQTPIAPSAGNGFIGGGTAGTGILLAILGIAALSAGATILAIGRKPNRG